MHPRHPVDQVTHTYMYSYIHLLYNTRTCVHCCLLELDHIFCVLSNSIYFLFHPTMKPLLCFLSIPVSPARSLSQPPSLSQPLPRSLCLSLSLSLSLPMSMSLSLSNFVSARAHASVRSLSLSHYNAQRYTFQHQVEDESNISTKATRRGRTSPPCLLAGRSSADAIHVCVASLATASVRPIKLQAPTPPPTNTHKNVRTYTHTHTHASDPSNCAQYLYVHIHTSDLANWAYHTHTHTHRYTHAHTQTNTHQRQTHDVVQHHNTSRLQRTVCLLHTCLLHTCLLHTSHLTSPLDPSHMSWSNMPV